MKIIDLSQPLFDGMEVFPGDPKVVVEQQQEFSKDGWNMKRLHINLHDGTHLNVPIHGTKNGRILDSYKLEDFIGKCRLYKKTGDIQKGIGIIFGDKNIDWEMAKIIAKKLPKFVGLSSAFEFDVDIEKFLLEKGIISFERLANTDKLPSEFVFYGVPLKIKDGDGSPIRAFAVSE
ncbi:MAG TPA: cyclase family protein [Patescibacteria group bacterium]|nr:cyclase family protein [Patescibacteria group bacterium]